MDEKQFEQLYIDYKQRLIHYAMPMGAGSEDAEEIADEAFVRLWNNRYNMNSVETNVLLTWLYRTVRLISLEYGRKAGAPVVEDISDYVDELPAEDTATEIIDQEENERIIHELQSVLTEDERLIFKMIILENRPYSEVSAVLKFTPAALRLKIHRMRKKLKFF